MVESKNPFVFLDASINGSEPRRMVFELFSVSVPKMAENFRALCTGESRMRNEDGKLLHYKGTIFHRVIKGLWAQGSCFSDSDDLSRAHEENHHDYHVNLEDNNKFLHYNEPGTLLVPNVACGKNGSEFCITFNSSLHLDRNCVVIGKLVHGLDTLMEIEKVDTNDGKPIKPVEITNSGEFYGCINVRSFPEKNGAHSGCSTHISKLYGPAKRRRVSAIRDFPPDCGLGVGKEAPIEVVATSMASSIKSLVDDTKSKCDELITSIRHFPSGCGSSVNQEAPIEAIVPSVTNVYSSEKKENNESPVEDTKPKDQIDVAASYIRKSDRLISSLQDNPKGCLTASTENKLEEFVDAITALADVVDIDGVNEKTEVLGNLTSHVQSKKDVLECVKEVRIRASILYGPSKRRSLSAVRDFPVGFCPSSAKISGDEGTVDKDPEVNNFVSCTKFTTGNKKWMEDEGNNVKEEGNDFILREAECETPELQKDNKKAEKDTFRQRTYSSSVDCLLKQSIAESSVENDLASETCENLSAVELDTCMGDMDDLFVDVTGDGTINEVSKDALLPDNEISLGGGNLPQVVHSKELDRHVSKRSLKEVSVEDQTDNVLTDGAGRIKLFREKLTKALDSVEQHRNKPSRLDAKSHLNAKAVDNETKISNRKSIDIKPEKKIFSCKRRYSKEEEGASNIISQQIRQGMDTEVYKDRLIVQALMAAPNCPWRSGKTTKTTRNSPLPVKKRSKDRNERMYNKRTSPDRLSDSGEICLLGDQNLKMDEENWRSPSPVCRELSVMLTPLGPPRVNPKGGCSSNIKDTPPRNRVRRTLRLFQVICRKLLQEEETRTREPGRSQRVDLKAATILKEKNEWINPGKPILGIVPGVEIGDEFHYRTELSIVGLHRPFQGGIDSTKKGNILLATSIVAGGNADELDNSDVLIYSGSGGLPANSDKPPEDQKLERGNLALKNSIDAKEPVRVIRGSKELKSDTRDGKPKFFSTFTYDGLYMVEKYWKEKVPQGFLAFKFQLRRIPGQPELAMKEVKKSKKLSARPGQCVKDISDGKEKIPICVVNTIDDERPPLFKYITKIMYPSHCLLSPPRGCDCKGSCSDSEKCACTVKNGGEIPYNYNGAIVQAKPLVYECGPSCKCPPTCYNRVSQHGIKIQLEVFKTESCGWGVRSLNSISSGSFICEYIGELLPDNVAEQLNNDEYLFGIGHNYDDSLLWEGLPGIIPEETSNTITEVLDDDGFTIDASQNANVGRFLNHSCSPNLYAQNVLYDHDDRKMPHIMFFAAENISPLQELTYHYNYTVDQVYDNHGNLKRKDCHCGSHECSGRLY